MWSELKESLLNHRCSCSNQPLPEFLPPPIPAGSRRSHQAGTCDRITRSSKKKPNETARPT
jgi:hypothetical protein